MNIGITGYKGFIGSNLIQSLVLSSKKPFCSYGLEFDNVDMFFDEPEKELDAVVHCMGANRGSDAALSRVNVIGTLAIANFCKEKNIRLINVSTSYSNNSMYKASKQVGDEIIKQYRENFDCDFANLWLPKVIGEGCKPFYNSFVTTIIYLWAHNKPYKHLIKDMDEILELIDIRAVTAKIIKLLISEESLTDDHFCREPSSYFLSPFCVTFNEIISILEGNTNSVDDHVIKYIIPTFQRLMEYYKNVK